GKYDYSIACQNSFFHRQQRNAFDMRGVGKYIHGPYIVKRISGQIKKAPARELFVDLIFDITSNT
ncbi:MAG: hypothetical protein RBT40_08235, partial [Petrimonas sp.]|nr:hypothetical protein [Petrimonas sp.]